MSGYVCIVCGGNCDAGELHAGVCDECITELAERERRSKEIAAMLLCEPNGQMVLEV